MPLTAATIPQHDDAAQRTMSPAPSSAGGSTMELVSAPPILKDVSYGEEKRQSPAAELEIARATAESIPEPGIGEEAQAAIQAVTRSNMDSALQMDGATELLEQIAGADLRSRAMNSLEYHQRRRGRVNDKLVQKWDHLPGVRKKRALNGGDRFNIMTVHDSWDAPAWNSTPPDTFLPGTNPYFPPEGEQTISTKPPDEVLLKWLNEENLSFDPEHYHNKITSPAELAIAAVRHFSRVRSRGGGDVHQARGGRGYGEPPS